MMCSRFSGWCEIARLREPCGSARSSACDDVSVSTSTFTESMSTNDSTHESAMPAETAAHQSAYEVAAARSAAASPASVEDDSASSTPNHVAPRVSRLSAHATPARQPRA
eukprot:2889921-Prymnesium_polylepis.1